MEPMLQPLFSSFALRTVSSFLSTAWDENAEPAPEALLQSSPDEALESGKSSRTVLADPASPRTPPTQLSASDLIPFPAVDLPAAAEAHLPDLPAPARNRAPAEPAARSADPRVLPVAAPLALELTLPTPPSSKESLEKISVRTQAGSSERVLPKLRHQRSVTLLEPITGARSHTPNPLTARSETKLNFAPLLDSDTFSGNAASPRRWLSWRD
jgi:hypothetical protein